jgi:glycosyltransferase involved in cell wall biosynthesis
MPKERILFVSHSAGRNGATILLLQLLRWLRDHTDYRLEVLVNGSGELIRAFQSIGRTTVWRCPTAILTPLSQTAWSTRLESQLLRLRMIGRSYDLVYFNTSAVASLVPALAGLADRVLWHIHELEYALRNTMSDEQIHQLFPMATRFVAVSNSVGRMLVGRFKVPQDKLDLIHGFVHLPNLSTEEVQLRRREIRRELGWPQDAFVVGGCGALGWRKGTDIFLQITREMLKSTGQDRTRFLWVGGGSEDEVLRFEHDVRSLGLEKHCQNVSTTAAVMDYYHAMDVFALTSREDPFPLVMLEASACRLPVVCFAESGGGPEFVGDDSGLIAPYLDVPAFAKHLRTLQGSPELSRKFGVAGAEKVRYQYVAEVQGPKLLASIKRCLSARTTNS